MKEFFDFIKNSPTSYHVTENVRQRLLAEGYTELFENEAWELEDGKGYFTTRSGSALVAFRKTCAPTSFMLAASHSDSPAFKVKLSEERSGIYTRLPVEKYGGMIMYSWLDRPLSVAGRLVLKTDGGIKTALVNVERDLMTIPSVAIHFNRSVNDGYKFNPAKDMIPLLSCGVTEGALRKTLAECVGAEPDDIINHDLFVYSRVEPKSVGLNGEFILSPRLDDLECVWASLSAFLLAPSSAAVPVLAVFDNEEVGSATIGGADSSFLADVLERVAGSRAEMVKMLSSSLAVSADNAHAVHPNAPELSDPDNAPVLGGGVVIKYNSNKRYATDAVSAALFQRICDKAGVKTQSYYNRADMPGGSTLGAILNTQLSIPTLDIGLAQLAMHSSVETAHADDLTALEKALCAFFASSLEICGNDIKIN